MSDDLTNAEYAILGLLVEKPSHGYDLEQLIETRGMREWTELAFSSIYYILKRLEKRGLIAPQKPGKKKTRKSYAPTPGGYALHKKTTLHRLAKPGPSYPSILLAMANWPAVEQEEARAALQNRRLELEKTQNGLIAKTPPAPDFVAVLFDYSISHIACEINWIDRALEKLGETP